MIQSCLLGLLVFDPEFRELSRCCLPLNVQVCHNCAGWPFLAPRHELFKARLLTFSQRLDTAIWAILHPTPEAKLTGTVASGCAKIHTLHSTTDNQVDSFHFPGSSTPDSQMLRVPPSCQDTDRSEKCGNR